MHKTFSAVITEINNKTNTSLLICASMLIAGVIMFASKHTVGWLFICVGIVLAYSLYNKKKNLKQELSKVDNLDRFCRLYDSDYSVSLDLLGLTICGDYAVLTIPVLKIYPMNEMAKFEVGLQGDVRKALFLTDKDGKRFKIAETQKGDALQEEFDRAYEAVRDYFNNRH